MTQILDNRDRKIMFELDKNSRQSIAQISKNTKIPRNIVEYHLKKLTEHKIITKFVTEVALGKIGYSTYKIFCQISGLLKEEQETFYNDLITDPQFIWIAQCEGRWDLLLAIYARNVTEFSAIRKKFLLRYGKYISDYAITIVDEAYILERIYLVDGKKREFVELYSGGAQQADLDPSDKKLLQLMANDARIKLIVLSQKMNLNIRTVLSKIKRLENRGIIQGYTTFFDLNKMNYHFYKMCIYLKEPSQQRYTELMNFCKDQKYIIHLIEAIGPWELELEIEVPSPREFQDLNNDIRNYFSDIVRKVESVIISHEMKLEFLPKRI